MATMPIRIQPDAPALPSLDVPGWMPVAGDALAALLGGARAALPWLRLPVALAPVVLSLAIATTALELPASQFAERGDYIA